MPKPLAGEKLTLAKRPCKHKPQEHTVKPCSPARKSHNLQLSRCWTIHTETSNTHYFITNLALILNIST